MWVDLSAELWLLILSFVETESLLNVMCVKFFKQITDRQQFWFERLAREFPEVCRKDWHGAKDSYKQALWFDRRDWRKICVEDVSLGDSRQVNQYFVRTAVKYHARVFKIVTPTARLTCYGNHVKALFDDLDFFDFILNLERHIVAKSHKQEHYTSIVITMLNCKSLRLQRPLNNNRLYLNGKGRLVLRVCSHYCIEDRHQGLSWKIDQILN